MKEFTKLRDIAKWPTKSNKSKANPDSKLSCDYHGNYGHKAYNCVALQKELYFLIKKGYLTEFMTGNKTVHVKRERSPNRDDKTPMRQPPPPPYHKVITFIVGGSEVCGLKYSHTTRVARETDIRVAQAEVNSNDLPTLTFVESNNGSIQEPKQDGLVISFLVGNCLIRRILVDNGSASNIMMLSTPKQTGLGESDMIKKMTTLVGFSEKTKRTMGEITLPTYAQ
ncbi:uncharacterized protein LOC141690474 [Apium graveolens]|uniref:uncharacterized protein LOC141690474 n=1 Tax=Apium graveolens TaxID=4045 RepID=UPI003D7ACCDB